MAWLEFRQRFIPDFQKTYGRLPNEREIAEAEASFQQYLQSHAPGSEAEATPAPPPPEGDSSGD